MNASVVLDGRCRALRRRLGPVAWMILEEAALTVNTSVSPGALWSPLSVRRVADDLGLGRDAAARGLSVLVSEGLLRRGGSPRGVTGRFVAGGYWLAAPAGLVLSDVAGGPVSDGAVFDGAVFDGPVSGVPGPGGPGLVVPATVTAGEDGRGGVAGGGRGPVDDDPVVAAGQASLFAVVGGEGDGHLSAAGTPRVAMGSVGAGSSCGGGVVSGVHELAPGVPGGTHPVTDRRPVGGGGAGC